MTVLEEDVQNIIKDFDMSKFNNKTVLVTGATGLIGKLCVKSLLECDYKVKVIGTRGFEFAETVRGGVPLDEIDEYCASKIVPNLCITGELIDIDARCGGYNLTNAWITGILAGEAND